MLIRILNFLIFKITIFEFFFLYIYFIEIRRGPISVLIFKINPKIVLNKYLAIIYLTKINPLIIVKTKK